MSCVAVSWTRAQDRTADVHIVRPDSSFTNDTDSTFFAISRYRVERLVARAELADSLAIEWTREYIDQENDRRWWRSVAFVSVIVAVVEFAILIWR